MLLIWYQESSSQLAMGATFGPEAPTEEVFIVRDFHLRNA